VELIPIICLDPGHNDSGADAGAEGNNMREQDLTLDIALKLRSLLEYNGFAVVLTREGPFVKGAHQTVKQSLQSRCQIANRAGADLFLSLHINAGRGSGTEVYALPGGQAEKLAGILLYYLIQEARWANRDVKTNRNFYVLVNTVMPAVLTENGFIDNALDAVKLSDPGFRCSLARAHAKGICDFYKLQYRDPPE
jgi:N-acetylmuramoyl-L-alanine amidase